MAMGLSDRQRVELCLPIHMMLMVLISGGDNPQSEEAVEAKLLLLEAAIEPLGDLPPEQRLKLVRRVKRVHRDIMAPYQSDETKAAEIGLIAFYMLRAITDAGFLVIGEESKFGRALELMLPAIEREMDGEIDVRAKDRARSCLKLLQTAGYCADAAVLSCFEDGVPDA